MNAGHATSGAPDTHEIKSRRKRARRQRALTVRQVDPATLRSSDGARRASPTYRLEPAAPPTAAQIKALARLSARAGKPAAAVPRSRGEASARIGALRRAIERRRAAGAGR
jgi:hypothetical protein